MSGEYFHQPDPEDPLHGPQLPERYWARSLADIYPDSIVYPDAHALAVNEADNKLYIKLATDLDDSAYEWSKSTRRNRIGLLRVYMGHPASGRTIDGFIADVRPLSSLHNIERTTVASGKHGKSDDGYRYTRLLGVIYKATDGTNRYSADPLDYTATEDAALMLAQHMDALINASQTHTTPTVEQTEPLISRRRPLPGPGPSTDSHSEHVTDR